MGLCRPCVCSGSPGGLSGQGCVFCGSVGWLIDRLDLVGGWVLLKQVEAQDDGVLVSIFPTGGSDEEFAAGTPLGVICDNLDDVALVQTAKNITAEDLDCNNIYACPELLERAFLWQAYSKSKPVEDI